MKPIISSLIFLLSLSILSQPRLIISLSGGYNLPMGELKGNISDSSDRLNTYGIKNGFNIGLNGKYAIDKKRNFRITFGGSFNRMSGEGEYIHGNKVKEHKHMNIISAGLGAEYSFTPKGKTNPFIGFELTGNFISGETEETVTLINPSVFHEHAGTTKKNLKSASRFGITLGGGIEFSFSKNIGALIGAKYSMVNLIGKQYDSVAAVGEYNLNDKESGSLKTKNISLLQIYAGVSYYLMHPSKRK
ncbi:MAG: porin family protein [Ignavibacteria bacterium]|nr:porin family protein [Ignavibacteria bacterium]